MLHVKPSLESDFEAAFKEASKIISSMDGYLSHELHRCIEVQGKYLLLVRWESLESHTVGFRNSAEYQESHTVGFRNSAEYQEWKKLLHHFYEPFPTVEHFEEIKI